MVKSFHELCPNDFFLQMRPLFYMDGKRGCLLVNTNLIAYKWLPALCVVLFSPKSILWRGFEVTLARELAEILLCTTNHVVNLKRHCSVGS
jgi:hypothetical protein